MSEIVVHFDRDMSTDGCAWMQRDPEHFPEVAYFVRNGKVERVQGRVKIQQLAREEDAYPTQYHGTREAAEEYVEMTYEPVKFAWRVYSEGKITEAELRQMVGDLAAAELIAGG